MKKDDADASVDNESNSQNKVHSISITIIHTHIYIIYIYKTCEKIIPFSKFVLYINDMYFRKTATNKNRNVCRGNVDGEPRFLQILHPHSLSQLIHSK